eukprot:893880-Prorocentrum_lima.AAC.1
MSTPGASSHVPSQFGFSPAVTTPRGSPGEAHAWDTGHRPPSFGAKLPVWYLQTPFLKSSKDKMG